MNIGLTCFPKYGGSGVVASELGKALARRGHQVHFITTELPFRIEELTENLFFHQVTAMPYPVFETPPYTLALASRMAEVAEQARLDILHAHYAIPHATAAYLARACCNCPTRIITTLHGTDTRLVGLDPSYWRITRFSMMQADGLTAVSHYLRDLSVKDFHLDKDVRVIYNFVDTEQFRPARCPFLRHKLAGEDERILVHLSNFRPVKRVPDIVRAFALVAHRIKSRLLLVGTGPDRAEAERLAVELEIADHVNFLGPMNDVSPVLSIADLFLMASEQESFGLAALEAMSCQVPVIATRVGGLPELVKDGETGYLVPLGDVEAMAARIRDLLSDEDRRLTMARNARQRAVEEFNADRIVSQYEEYYQEVLHRSGLGW